MKIINSRRGVSMPMRVLVELILVLLAGFLVTLFITGIYRDVSLSTDRNLCLSSVFNAEATSIAGLDSPFNLEGCDTRIHEFKIGKKFKTKRDDRVFRHTVETQDEIAKVVSEELAGCAWQFGEGNHNPFGSYANWNDNVRCVVCSELTFDEDLVTSIDRIDLSSYMKNNNYKSKETPGVNKPYKEILGFNQDNFAPLAIESGGESVEYSIIFGLGQTNDMVNWANGVATLGAVTAGTAGAAGGALLGCKAGAAIGTSSGAAFFGVGALPGAIFGCFAGGVAGGLLGGGTGAVVGGYSGYKAAEFSSYVSGADDWGYFDFEKSYSYAFIKDHKKKEGYEAAFAIVPSTTLGGKCDKLY
jgi:hypothetical protein